MLNVSVVLTDLSYASDERPAKQISERDHNDSSSHIEPTRSRRPA